MRSLIELTVMGCLGLCAAATSAAADAIPYPNSGHVAPTSTFKAGHTGDLDAYFYGSTAGYSETLGAFDQTTGVNLGADVFPNHATDQGAFHNFGQVNAGDTLVFFINVLNTGDTFYSDPSRNSDGTNHAYATTYMGGVAGIPPGTFVGFEDLPYGQSDLNYNDETFVFTNTMSSVPLPASAPMFGAAVVVFGAVGYGVKRKSRAAA